MSMYQRNEKKFFSKRREIMCAFVCMSLRFWGKYNGLFWHKICTLFNKYPLSKQYTKCIKNSAVLIQSSNCFTSTAALNINYTYYSVD